MLFVLVFKNCTTRNHRQRCGFHCRTRLKFMPKRVLKWVHCRLYQVARVAKVARVVVWMKSLLMLQVQRYCPRQENRRTIFQPRFPRRRKARLKFLNGIV